MQLCMQQVPPDHPEAMDGGIWTSRVHPSDDIDPMNVAHSNSTMVATTPWMEDFVADCMNRVPQPAPPEERDRTYDACFSLFTLIAGAPDSAFHTPLQQQQESMDRARWRAFHARPPIMAIVEAKWRHWKPGRLKEESATTQRKLELHLRDRWAENHWAPTALCQRHPLLACGPWGQCSPRVLGPPGRHQVQDLSLSLLREHPEIGLQHNSLGRKRY